MVAIYGGKNCFGSEWVQFKLSFGPRRFRHDAGFGSERGRFGSGFGPIRFSARDGFWADTSFRTRRGSGRVSYRFDQYRFDPYRFESNRFDQYRFDPYRFNQYRFDPYRFKQYRLGDLLERLWEFYSYRTPFG
ncbi:hypothetical protein HanPSC8_Chr11g0490231 [Helianthus annuus]|nr:hypothetical protein HanPSC8_Chr11g0490231 [Helianthus annuus]